MTEDKLQAACYSTANKLIPITRGLLYSVPNGAYLKNKVEAIKLLSTGLLPGVADMALDIPNSNYHGLKIELKLKGKKQSQHQINYQNRVTQQGYKYIVVDTLSKCINGITQYLEIDSISLDQKLVDEYDNY